MDNVQKRNIYTNVPSSETFGSYIILEQFNSFSSVKTPDDRQLGPKHVVNEEEK
jgi:hypothetical protein